MPNNPRCCDLIHGALRVLLGESGVGPGVVPLYRDVGRVFNTAGMLQVDLYGLSKLNGRKLLTSGWLILIIPCTHVWAGCGIETDLISSLTYLGASTHFSSDSMWMRRVWRRDGVRVNCGGVRLWAIASFNACFSVRPLLQVAMVSRLGR